jgi:hypothetical protein
VFYFYYYNYFFFFFFVTAKNPILRFSALLFNFQSQKSFSVLLVYKNLTHLHTNKTRFPRTAARMTASKVVLYLIYIILLFLYRNPREEGGGLFGNAGGGFTKVERGLCNCYETPSRWRRRFKQAKNKKK